MSSSSNNISRASAIPFSLLMSRSVFWAVVVFVAHLFAACTSSPETSGTDGLDAAIHEGAAYLNLQIQAGNKLAIIAVKSDYPRLSEYIIDTLTENMVNGRLFTVVERGQLDVIRGELNFQMSGEVDDNSAQTIGRMTGAQTIIVGAVSALGNMWRLSFRALTVEKAEVQGLFSKNISSSVIIPALTSGRKAEADVSPDSVSHSQREAISSSTPELHNGTYILMPRPRGRLDGVWEDIFISRIEVDDDYITIYFENKESEGDGYGRNGTVNWDRGSATLSDPDKPGVYKKNTGRTGQSNGNVSSCVFPRIGSKRLRLENRQGMVFKEIELGAPE